MPRDLKLQSVKSCMKMVIHIKFACDAGKMTSEKGIDAILRKITKTLLTCPTVEEDLAEIMEGMCGYKWMVDVAGDTIRKEVAARKIKW